MTLSRFLALAAATVAVAACHDSNPTGPSTAAPVVAGIEVGHDPENVGVLGEDLHFEAEVTAEARIETVQLRLVQQAGKTYARPWSVEVTWDQYRGQTTAHVHKHFDIPADGVAGEYDLLIIVKDQAGRTTQIRRDFEVRAVVAAPSISGVELGHDPEGVGLIGDEIHFEAEVEAPGKIATVTVRILPRAGETYSAPWSFELVWTEYAGSTTAHVHKHVDIPGDAVAEQYDFVVLVADQAGRTTEARYDFEVRAPIAAPTLSGIEVGNPEGAGQIGDDIHVEFDVTAPGKIATVTFRIVPRAGQSYAGPWSFEVVWTQYAGNTTANVHKHVDIPADAVPGTYDAVLLVTDQQGKTTEVRRTLVLSASAAE